MKKFSWLSLGAMLLNVISFGLFALFLTGGYYQTPLWFLWMFLCVLSPIIPIVAKYFRVNHYLHISGKVFEIIAIILSLFDFANLCTYGFGMPNGNLFGWGVLIVEIIIYVKAITENIKEAQPAVNSYISIENEGLNNNENTTNIEHEQINSDENFSKVNKEESVCKSEAIVDKYANYAENIRISGSYSLKNEKNATTIMINDEDKGEKNDDSLFCRKCGEKLPGDSGFCHLCGTKIIKKLICPSCGKEQIDGSEFCRFCGKEIK